MTTQAAPPAGAGPVFRFLLQTLLRHRWTLILIPGVVLGLVVLYLLTATPVYEASSSVIVDPPDDPSPIVDLTGLAANRDLMVEVEVLRSQDLARRVAARLLQQPGALACPDSTLPLLWDDGRTLRDTAAVVARLAEAVTADQVRREVGVLKVTARSTCPTEAALVANFYTEEYAHRNVAASREEATRLRAFIEEQLAVRGEALRDAEGALQTYQEREDAVALDQEVQQLTGRLADLQAQRDQGQVELRMVEAEVASLQTELARIEPNLNQRVSSSLEHEISRLQNEVAAKEVEIESKYARNPHLRSDPSRDAELVQRLQEVAALKAQVDERSRRFTDEVMASGGIDPALAGRLGEGANVSAALANASRLRRQINEKTIQANGLRARLGVLGQRLGQYEGEFQRIPSQARNLAALERERQRAATTFQWLQERHQEARLVEQSRFGSVQRLDQATTPREAVEPRPFYSLVLGSLMAVILALLVIAVRELTDARIRRPETLRQMGLPLLGLIPSLDRRLRLAPRPPTARLAPSLVLHHQPMTEEADAYLRVLAGLELSNAGPRLQTVLVTSPRRGEGKTTTAANLAVAIARAGRRTLLLDLNLLYPGTHPLFGERLSPGLTNVLKGQAQMRASVRKTAVDNLYLLPVGDAETGGAALLASRDLEALLAYLRHHFERIVIDGGALLTTGNALALTALSDAVLIVFRAGHTTTVDVEETRTVLGQINAPYTTCLLNDFDARAAFGTYNTQGYYGHYGSGQALPPVAERTPAMVLPALLPKPEPAKPLPPPPSAPMLPPAPSPEAQAYLGSGDGRLLTPHPATLPLQKNLPRWHNALLDTEATDVSAAAPTPATPPVPPAT